MVLEQTNSDFIVHQRKVEKRVLHSSQLVSLIYSTEFSFLQLPTARFTSISVISEADISEMFTSVLVLYICLYVYTYIYIYLYLCIYIFIYVFIYIQINVSFKHSIYISFISLFLSLLLFNSK